MTWSGRPYLTSDVSEGEGAEDPSLPVERPLELVCHRDDGHRHYDPVGGVDEVGRRAQADHAMGLRQHFH